MLWIAVFFANAAVMIFEVIGARAITPYVGGSVETWSGIIAAILGGMSIGYWLGGKLADAYPARRWLAYTLLLAGGLTILVWSLKDIFFPLAQVLAHSMPLSMATFLVGVLFFAPTSIFLAAVNPFAAKTKIDDLQSSARTVGKLSAVAAAGSVLGTIITGAWLVPSFGSSAIIYTVGGVLIVLGICSLGNDWKKNSFPVGLMLIAVVASAYVIETQAKSVHGQVLADIDTRYARVWITEEEDAKEGHVRYLRTDPYSTQCGAHINDDGSVSDDPIFEYVRDMQVGTDLFPGADTLAIAGGCNYSWPKYLHSIMPEADIDVIEIDEGMTEIAREWFGLSDEPGFDIFHEDARTFFNTDNHPEYDIVFLDAYNSFAAIPYQLTTKEAIEAIDEHLTPEGYVVANTIGAATGDLSAFIRAFTATLESIFPHVEAFSTYQGNDPENIQNIIMVASHTPFELPKEYARARLDIDTTGVSILTDEYAPVEALTKPVRNRVLKMQD